MFKTITSIINRKEVVYLKYRVLLIVLVLGVIFSYPLSAGASTMDQDCTICHGTYVSDFYSPNVQAADRIRCYQCHNQGLHTRDYNSTPIFIVRYIDPNDGKEKGAVFLQDPNTVTTVNLHAYHSLPDPRASSCAECHINFTCYSCHQTIPHEQHSATEYSPVSLWMTSGVFGGPAYYTNSCATSNCHGTFAEPYNPVTSRSDEQQLCINCHSNDNSGHTDSQLAMSHSTTLTNDLTFSNQLTGTYVIDCSGCHISRLDTEHANRNRDCAACHQSPNNAVLSVIDTANGIEANRACDECHFNVGVIPVPEEHPLFHIATQSNNLRVDGAPHATCNTCHDRASSISMTVTVNGTVYQKTIAEVAAMAPKDYSCLGCHNSSGTNPRAPVHNADYNGQQMSVLDVHSSCASCHAPDNTYAAVVDTIIMENRSSSYSCTECHADLSAGHKATFESVLYTDTTAFHLKCTDCHNSAYKSTVSSLKEQVQLGIGYDCSACHSSVSVKGTSPYYPAHTADGDGIVGFHPSSCSTCHGVANGAYAINLDPIRDQLPTPGYSCADCHNGVIAANGYHQAKADSASTPENVSTTYHSLCTTCHGNTLVQPVIDSLKGQVTEPYLCSVCHNADLNLEPGHKAKMASADTVESTITDYHLDDAGNVACGMCHGTDKLPAGIISDLKAAGSYLCSDCHQAGSVIAYSHTADFGTEALNQDTTAYHDACQTCHDNTAARPVINNLIGMTGYDCNQCHNGAVTYQAVHMAKMDTVSDAVYTVGYHNNCFTCHSSSDTAVSSFIDTNKGTATAYLCSDCHGDITLKHQSTTNLSSSTFMINCSWCHSSTETAYADSNLIGAHVYPNITLNQAYTCDTCHGSSSPVKSQVANNQTACDACHNDISAPASHPDNQYIPRHQADPFPSFLPEYSPNCSGCHVSNVINEHSPYYIGCVTCHTQGAYKPAVVSLDVDCNGCHTSSVSTVMDMVYSHELFHYSDTTLYPDTAGCLECHAKDTTTDGQSLLAVHKQDSTSTVTCDTCHGSTARQEVKDAITGDNISCQACHSTTTGHQHPVSATGYDPVPSVDCSKCHATAAGGTAELAAIHKDAGDRGLITGYSCATCHNSTFEGADSVILKDGNLDMLKNGVTVIYCTDCHNGTLTDALGTKYPAHDGSHTTTAAGYGQYNWDSGANCAQCHTTLGIYGNHLYTGSGTSCNTCHTSTVTAVTGAIESNWSRAAVKSGYTCSECHNSLPYGHQYEHNSTGDEPVTCSGCHDGTTVSGAFNVPAGTNTTVSDTGIHPACNKC
ncbi:MAG: hypothetical protein CVU89_14270, partial [Firmicutes bacterium HGW-Firmicutes-14]